MNITTTHDAVAPSILLSATGFAGTGSAGTSFVGRGFADAVLAASGGSVSAAPAALSGAVLELRLRTVAPSLRPTAGELCPTPGANSLRTQEWAFMAGGARIGAGSIGLVRNTYFVKARPGSNAHRGHG